MKVTVEYLDKTEQRYELNNYEITQGVLKLTNVVYTDTGTPHVMCSRTDFITLIPLNLIKQVVIEA